MNFRRVFPLLLLLFLMALAYLSGVQRSLSFETLRQNREALQLLAARHPYVAALLFTSVYALSTALSLPLGATLSIFGGFLFSQPFSTCYVVIGATLGATLLFIVAKSALSDLLRRRAGPFVQKMRAGFQKEAAGYLLFLRLVPLFPFWTVNIASACFGVDLFTFFWTTLLGIVPGAFALTQAGAGLGAILDAGGELTVEKVLNPQVKLALIALGLFSLLPMLIKQLKRRR